MPRGSRTFELTTWERVSLVKALGELQGNLATLRCAGKALDALELSEDERAMVRFQTITTPQGGAFHQWLDQAHTFTVEIADPDAAAMVVQYAARYEGWCVADLERVEALLEKLRDE